MKYVFVCELSNCEFLPMQTIWENFLEFRIEFGTPKLNHSY